MFVLANDTKSKTPFLSRLSISRMSSFLEGAFFLAGDFLAGDFFLIAGEGLPAPFGAGDFLELVDGFGARLLKIADGCRAHGLHSRETRRHGPLIGSWHGLSRSGDHQDDQLRDGQEDQETEEELLDIPTFLRRQAN